MVEEVVCKALKKICVDLEACLAFLTYYNSCRYTWGELISSLATSDCSAKCIIQLGEHSDILFKQRDVAIFSSTSQGVAKPFHCGGRHVLALNEV